MIAAVTLLLLRVGGRQTLEFGTLKKVPWETLLLLGGGFAMGAGIEKSGLALWMGNQLRAVHDLPPFFQILMASVVTVGLTAVASNTATIGVMLSVLRSAVPAANLTPVLFAATIAASCDFALPAGTPPNAIVFGSGYLTVPKMAKTGVILDLIAAVLAAAWCWLIVRFVF
jgi:sodium-dependent dicarboxylate transporter 2/3/5